jgi:glycine/D-amino acid oxidase-like deaminating enzyme
MQTDILVIGGGILGCATATFLTRKGASVIVVDKGKLANEATRATTAGITLQNRTPDRLPFYRAAAQYWPSLGEMLEADLGYTQSGSLAVAHTAVEFDRLQEEVKSLQQLNLEVECLSASEAKAIAPWLADDIAGATYCPGDGFVEPDRPAQAFVEAAQRHGATFLPDHPVKAIQVNGPSGFRTETVNGEISSHIIVNAAGAWAGRIAAMVGVELQVTLDPLQAMATEPAEPWLDMIVLHASKKLTMKQNQNGRVVIGGGWKAEGSLDGAEPQLIEANRIGNLSLAQASVPRINHLRIERQWCGLEGRSPDRYPFFGEVTAVPGFFLLACVHGGLTMSPLLGEQLAELIVDGRLSFPMWEYTSRSFLPLTELPT